MGIQESYEKQLELADGLVSAHGSWASVMTSPTYLQMAQENLGFMRKHFDLFSAEAPSCDFSEEVIQDVSNGTLEHHSTIGCTQDEYDQLVETGYHEKVRKQKRAEEAFMMYRL